MKPFNPNVLAEYNWIVSYHLYLNTHEFRFQFEADARLKFEEVERAFQVLLGNGYKDNIKKYNLTCKKIDKTFYDRMASTRIKNALARQEEEV